MTTKQLKEFQDSAKKISTIEELEMIKEELLKKVWRDAQGQIVTQDGFNHGIITAIDILNNHIMEIRK